MLLVPRCLDPRKGNEEDSRITTRTEFLSFVNRRESARRRRPSSDAALSLIPIVPSATNVLLVNGMDHHLISDRINGVVCTPGMFPLGINCIVIGITRVVSVPQGNDRWGSVSSFA